MNHTNSNNNNNNNNNDFSDYLNTSKNSCICISISIVIIILFFLTPLSNFLLASTIGKIIAILILSYAFITNTISTFDLSKKFNISLLTESSYTDGNSDLKTNIICSYTFSIFILLLIIMIVKKMITIKTII
jgi:hypothetical protein